MKNKVLYNAKIGGEYSLSFLVTFLYWKSIYGHIETYFNNELVELDDNTITEKLKEYCKKLHRTSDPIQYFEFKYNGELLDYAEYLPRHNSNLIKIVESLSWQEASSPDSRIQIKEIDSDTYYIDVYDGQETVLIPKDINWIKIS